MLSCVAQFSPLSFSSAYLARWLDLSAAKRVINDLPGYCNAMQEHADRSKTKVVMIPFDPPAKSSLPKKALDVDWLRSVSMGITTTFAWSSKLVGPSPMISRHPLAGSPADVTKRPRWVDHHEESSEWRTAYRLHEPEKDGPKVTSLQAAWQRNRKLVTEDLPARRPSWAQKVSAFAKRKSRSTQLHTVVLAIPLTSSHLNERFSCMFFGGCACFTSRYGGPLALPSLSLISGPSKAQKHDATGRACRSSDGGLLLLLS